ncbi:hypothetical protein GQ600_364 [Phytophthora cactorum]|nr:hypothetical protein GQ600_364 [Phytophthora cactorum]
MNRKTAPVKEAVISKMKKLAEQDPDLRSISSVVGKSPTQLSVKQVLDVQSFIKKDPEGRLPLVFCIFLWWVALLFLFLAAGVITVAVTAIPDILLYTQTANLEILKQTVNGKQ